MHGRGLDPAAVGILIKGIVRHTTDAEAPGDIAAAITLARASVRQIRLWFHAALAQFVFDLLTGGRAGAREEFCGIHEGCQEWFLKLSR